MGPGVKRASTLPPLGEGSLEKHTAETQLRAAQQADKMSRKAR